MRSAPSSRARTVLFTGLLLAGPVSEAVPLANGMKLGIDFGPTLTANWNNITTTTVTFSFQTDSDPATPVGSGVFGYSGRTTTTSLTGDYLLLLNQTVDPNNATVHGWQINGLVPGICCSTAATMAPAAGWR